MKREDLFNDIISQLEDEITTYILANNIFSYDINREFSISISGREYIAVYDTNALDKGLRVILCTEDKEYMNISGEVSRMVKMSFIERVKQERRETGDYRQLMEDEEYFNSPDEHYDNMMMFGF